MTYISSRKRTLIKKYHIIGSKYAEKGSEDQYIDNSKKKKNRMGGPETMKFGFGKVNDDVETPPDLLKPLNAEFNFDFDPCPIRRAEGFDGLVADWGKRNYVNPPFSNIMPWVEKATKELQKGNLSVVLIPCRPSTKYWHEFIFPYAKEIRFFRRGIKFKGYKSTLNIPICVAIFDPEFKREPQEEQNIGKYTVYKMEL